MSLFFINRQSKIFENTFIATTFIDNIWYDYPTSCDNRYRIVTYEPASDIIRRIPLSNKTTQNQTDNMAQFVGNSEFYMHRDDSTFKETFSFSLQEICRRKNPKNCYLRNVWKLIRKLRQYLMDFKFINVKAILSSNIFSVAIDGVKARVGVNVKEAF